MTEALAAAAEAPLSPEFRIANQANAVMGIYGISGTGKSSLADTAAEYAYETYGKITLCYAADLGGFGNKRLTLIRKGIMRVYDPRNHINPFETMELISLGAFPATLIDPERGYADPTAPLVLPRRMVYSLICPQNHVAGTFENEATLNVTSVACPTCGVATTLTNSLRVDRAIVRHRMFKDVGLRIYDSMTALNEWGMDDLQNQSAKGTLPAGHSGGSLLGAADALRSGQFVFGSSSVSQYGFLQNRTYGWLTNIKKIPDQVLPAIATFMVEQSKGNDESGGDLLLGPKISGNARTAALCGWLGHLLHATKEPNDAGQMVHRLWLVNHYDARDPRKIPYVAKHRGTPLGMPDYLEDAPGAAPWSTCSLGIFFAKLDQQQRVLEQAAAEKYPTAPGIWTGEEAGTDEVVGVRMAAGAGTDAGVPVPVTGGRTIGRRGRRPTATVVTGTPAPAVTTQPASVPVADGAGPAQPAEGMVQTPPPAVVQGVTTPPPVQPPVHVQQMQASLDAAKAGATGRGPTVATLAPLAAQQTASVAPPTPPPTTTTQPVAHSRIRRVPRPPTT